MDGGEESGDEGEVGEGFEAAEDRVDAVRGGRRQDKSVNGSSKRAGEDGDAPEDNSVSLGKFAERLVVDTEDVVLRLKVLPQLVPLVRVQISNPMVVRVLVVDDLPARALEGFVSAEALQRALDGDEDFLVELGDADVNVEHGLVDLGAEVVEACGWK